jgi:hypothetical protein
MWMIEKVHYILRKSAQWRPGKVWQYVSEPIPKSYRGMLVSNLGPNVGYPD